MLSRLEEERIAAFVDKELGIQKWEQAQGKGEEDSDYSKYDFAPVHAQLEFDQDSETYDELLDQASEALIPVQKNRDSDMGGGDDTEIRNQQGEWETWDEKPVGGEFEPETHGLAALEEEEEFVDDDRHKDFRELQRTWEDAGMKEFLEKWDGDEEEDDED